MLNVVRKLGPAIAAGCSIIIKPSEETPGSVLEVICCFKDAGLPGDVAQCIFGVPDKVSRRLLASPIPRKLSFTGSIPVGKHLLKLAADTVKRTTMELGGHSPVLVFDDCDVDATLDMLVANKFRNAGQACIGPTRFYVQDGVYDRFEAGFADRARAIRVGEWFAADTQMGPMANVRRPERIGALVEDARKAGAHVLTGGEDENEGFFYRPTVLADVPLTARAMIDEPFGPLALIARFGKIDEAVEHANRLPFGLAATASPKIRVGRMY